jgi:cellobiose phosphorylase
MKTFEKLQNKVLEALAEKESEKDLEKENEELRKENRDLKGQVKKLKKVKTGQGDEALEVSNNEWRKYDMLNKFITMYLSGTNNLLKHNFIQ